MPKVFICYRREDSAYPAHQIYTTLTSHFGTESVVFDVDTIPLGIDFRKYLTKQVGKCDILIAVIGDKWMESLNQGLDKPNDFVRIEIQAALKREIPVVPVLIGKASMPEEENLPPELSGLAYMQAAEVRAGPDLKAHLKRLIDGLEYLLAELKAEEEAEAESRRKEAEEAKRKVEEERLRKEAEEAKRQAEEERKRKEAEEAKQQAEEERKRKEAEEAKRKAKEERRHQEAEEAIRRQEQEDQERKAAENRKREEAAALLRAKKERIEEKPDARQRVGKTRPQTAAKPKYMQKPAGVALGLREKSQMPTPPLFDAIREKKRALGIGLGTAVVILAICLIAGDFYAQLLISALRHTSIIFMMGVGIVLVLRVNRIVNFAHGAFYLLGACVSFSAAAEFGQGSILHILIAILLGVFIGGLGILIETALLRRIYQLPVIHQILASAGIFFVLWNIIIAVFRPEFFYSENLYGPIEIFGTFTSTTDLFLIFSGLFVLVGLYFLRHKTGWMANQYSGEIEHKDNNGADASLRRSRIVVFFIAAALAGFTGAVSFPFAGDPSASISFLAGGFLVALLAGLGSLSTVYLAALIIGSFTILGSSFLRHSTLLFLTFVAIAIFLTWRPGGFFTKTLPELKDSGQPELPDRPGRRHLITAAAIVILLLAVPLIGGSYFIHLMPTFFVYALLGASLYFLMRTEGFISLGQSAFVAIGGYSAAILITFFEVPIIIAVPLSVIAAGLTGFLIALPCTRLAPVSIAMLTFVFAYTIYQTLLYSQTLTAGADGLQMPVELAPLYRYYISLLLCVMGFALILYAPFSRIYARLRDKTGQHSQFPPDTSRAFKMRCLSFTIAGTIAGLAGGIYVIHWRYIFPGIASIEQSLSAISVFVIGGIQSAFGPILGAVAVRGTNEFLAPYRNLWQIVIGAALIAIIMYYPKGLAGIFRKFFRKKHSSINHHK